MNTNRTRRWQIAGIVVLLATMLGGAYIGYRSAGSSATANGGTPVQTVDDPASRGSSEDGQASLPATSSAGTAVRSALANGEPENVSEWLRKGDSRALDELLPAGITQIEGRGGRGLSRMVKSHGVWFPLFDLTQAKRKVAASKTETDASDDPQDYEPDSVKLARIALAIVSEPPAAQTVGGVFAHRFIAVGGTPPYLWSGATPAGFALDAGTGLLSGATDKPMATSFTVVVTDSAGDSASAVATLVVTPVEELRITTSALPAGVVSQPYRATLVASGGVKPFTWTITSADPSWSCDASTGVFSGQSDQAGEYEIAVTVTDAQQSVASASFTLKIAASLEITTPSPLPPVAPQTNYSGTFEATGGTPPYEWRLAGGALPWGWQLSADGTLSGVGSNVERVDHFTLLVRDAAGATFRKTFELAQRHSLIVVPSGTKAGIAWQPRDIQLALRAPLTGVSVTRDGVEVYRGNGNNFVDHDLAPGPHSYALMAFTSDGESVPFAANSTRLLPMTRQRAVANVTSDPYADLVVEFAPLSAGGYGAKALPSNVLGPPDGRGPFSPAWRESEVASLHASVAGGGSIVLQFTDNIIEDIPGADFTVFENVIFVSGDPNTRFMEPGLVEVALFEGQWFRFPTRVNPSAITDPKVLRQPGYYLQGFAGVNGTTGDDPTDATRSGGDSFDLASLGVPGLQWIRYVRIRSPGDNRTPDSSGVLIRHTAENGALGGAGSSGFDLDAVSAVHP